MDWQRDCGRTEGQAWGKAVEKTGGERNLGGMMLSHWRSREMKVDRWRESNDGDGDG